jgi:hypothetical protein
MSETKTVEEFLREGAISRCGISCRFCASYLEHVKSDEDKRRCSDIWHRFMGFRVPPEAIRACPGCAESVYYGAGGADGADCAIRRCAVSRGAKTCAHCSAYRSGCSLHHGAHPEPDGEKKTAPEATTEAERLFFGEIGREQGNRSPEQNLAEIRASLAPGDLVDGNTPLKP